jgi:hypothetical protein
MKKYIAISLIYFLFIAVLSLDALYALDVVPFHCLFKFTTGYPCPFCGGIRAVVSMITLHPLEALKWNPLATSLFLILMLSPAITFLYIIFSRAFIPSSSSISNPGHSERSLISSLLSNSYIKIGLVVMICILVVLNWLWLIFWSPYSY